MGITRNATSRSATAATWNVPRTNKTKRKRESATRAASAEKSATDAEASLAMLAAPTREMMKPTTTPTTTPTIMNCTNIRRIQQTRRPRISVFMPMEKTKSREFKKKKKEPQKKTGLSIRSQRGTKKRRCPFVEPLGELM